VVDDDSIVCWGDNGEGQGAPPIGTFVYVSCGDMHTCGLKKDNTVVCWGANYDGQSTPPKGEFIQISAGYEHTCGLKRDGAVLCWGSLDDGGLRPPAMKFKQVAVGASFACGLTIDGAIECWGDDYWNGGLDSNADGPFVQMSVSYSSTIGLRKDGTFVRWEHGFEPHHSDDEEDE
jgi:alpha-tubulin suppressor-like RCC1 family protein